ncbi:TlpA family protein disulfide reductase [Flavobacterium lacus]|uniref:Thiol-disulfide isomerase/thioredoxin n=1 Tax=Flavobacterium lacus TaxID=1353778 RepID=A0A328WLR8_9FLAO|nr:redoxin domain-containing protein [Flavobacterium lacus]RAR47123.1 thiol-disulfide isomerase/thioredoxin [Flavobacterium lacus]
MKIIILIVVFVTSNLSVLSQSIQEPSKSFTEAIRTNFVKYKNQSSEAYRIGDFERGQFLFDSLVQNQLIGSKFNDYTLKRINNRKLKMSKVKKPIFLVTYAAWCIPGKGEIPALNKLAKENKAIEFIVIVFGKKKEAGKFAKKFNSSIEIGYAHKNYKNDNEIVESMRETLGFPTCYMIDEHLQVVNIKRGSASTPLKTPTKKAVEMNYSIFSDRLSELIQLKQNKKELLVTN